MADGRPGPTGGPVGSSVALNHSVGGLADVAEEVIAEIAEQTRMALRGNAADSADNPLPRQYGQESQADQGIGEESRVGEIGIGP